MAKATTKKASTNKVSNAKKKDLLDPKAYQFLKEYINNPSPVGFESSGQKIWLNYLTQYVDTTFSDPYGTAVGVINPVDDVRWGGGDGRMWPWKGAGRADKAY